jgi:hypothetical protein
MTQVMWKADPSLSTLQRISFNCTEQWSRNVYRFPNADITISTCEANVAGVHWSAVSGRVHWPASGLTHRSGRISVGGWQRREEKRRDNSRGLQLDRTDAGFQPRQACDRINSFEHPILLKQANAMVGGLGWLLGLVTSGGG